MTDKVTVCIWITEELRRKLKVCAAENGTRLSTIASQAFEEYLVRYERRKKRDVVVPLATEDEIA